MDRTFERSTRRRRRTLDGQWEFVTDPRDVGVEEGYAESFPGDAETVPVPCSWNALSGYADYVGPAWYHRTVSLPESTGAVFTFHGVGHDATVYLDGEGILSHAGGYTPFSTYVRDLDAGEHDLVVRADNSRDETTLLHGDADWFPHGGLYREVVVAEVSGIWVSEFDVDYELDGDGASVESTVVLHNVSPTPTEGQAVFSVGEATVTEEVAVGGLDADRVVFEATVADVDRWSPADPTLYDAVVAVSDDRGGDDLRERIGFREIDVDDESLRVNGDPVDVVGVNRGEFHPDWGHAEPLRVQRGDVKAIVDAGFNAVRAARYPVHPRFLDLCDEAGLLVIEGVSPHEVDPTVENVTEGDTEAEIETIREAAESDLVPDHVTRTAGVGSSPDDPVSEGDGSDDQSVTEFDDPTGEARRIMTEMIQRDANHPCIVAWSLGNGTADPSDRMENTLRTLSGTATGVDGTRPVTGATDLEDVDEGVDILEHSDLVCVNAGRRTEPDWDETIDSLSEAFPDKPLLVTEFGPEGVAGERTLADRRESESRQARELLDAVETFEARDDLGGFAVRRFSDALAGARPDAGVRTIDYSGLVTAHRRPKEAYRTLCRHLADD
ncbi:MAG: glycoside hydrolase family 2 TIM barrel-domain containing protein [Haloarculaceae archaeon]